MPSNQRCRKRTGSYLGVSGAGTGSALFDINTKGHDISAYTYERNHNNMPNYEGEAELHGIG